MNANISSQGISVPVHSFSYKLVCLLLLISTGVFAQQERDTTGSIDPLKLEQEVDTARAYIADDDSGKEQFQKDSIGETINDFSPLDIGSNRGIFILSANKLLQLRILGSIRANATYSDQELDDNNTFNPYDIPTNVDRRFTNYYAGVEQTRLGFEVTRRTKTRGDIFIRLEGDFKSSSGGWRIRHAYGQMGRFLIGKTWSLLNNVGYQPAIVSMDGPVGSIGIRNTQIRYSHRMNDKFSWDAAIEYSSPQINIPDSIDASVIQVIPDFTARVAYNTQKFNVKFSGALTTVSGRLRDRDVTSVTGYLLSGAGLVNAVKGGNLFMSASLGKSTAHFLDTFNGKDIDLIFNPTELNFSGVFYWSAYAAYSHDLPSNLSASASFGYSAIENERFQKEDAFSHSYNALFNIFWEPVTGARLGIEYANGRRYDKGEADGPANRLSLLMYYDF